MVRHAPRFVQYWFLPLARNCLARIKTISIVAIKFEAFSVFLYGLIILVGGALLHYIAARFAYAGQSLIDSTPYKISSKNIPDSLGLIALFLGVAIFFGLLYASIETSEANLFLIALAALIAGVVVGTLFLNISSCLNIHESGKQTTAGETGLGILVLFFRAILSIGPDILIVGAVLNTLGNLYAGVLLLSKDFEKNFQGSVILETCYLSAILISLSPVYLYIVYVLYIMMADLIKSIFDMAKNMDKLSNRM